MLGWAIAKNERKKNNKLRLAFVERTFLSFIKKSFVGSWRLSVKD
jgi:hypothetical protein